MRPVPMISASFGRSGCLIWSAVGRIVMQCFTALFIEMMLHSTDKAHRCSDLSGSERTGAARYRFNGAIANETSCIAAAGSGASRWVASASRRVGRGMRRFPVVARAGPDLHLYETVVFLCERNPAGQVGVTCYSGNRMSDDQDHSLDLTQWVKVEAAPDGGILAGVVGEARVFVWRKGNRLKAYNADCPHLGGPLHEGGVAGPTIRGPWHHACFDLATGEATAAPAFDALHEYAVTLDDDRFCVKSARAKTPRRTGRREDSLGTIAIVGGGAAGFAAADAIRKLGWRGGITIFSEEREQPYDRTLLTKDYLEGSFGDDRLPIARHLLADLGVDFAAGAGVQKIVPGNKHLRSANGD